MAFNILKEYFGGAVKVIQPKIFKDSRGDFFEAFRADQFLDYGLPEVYPQINQSRSYKNVVRGLHFQWEPPMSKLMKVVLGEAFLVAVDIRKDSPTLGKWVSVEASADNRKHLWAQAGFARGFCALSDIADIQYMCTSIYNPDGEGGISWNDPEIGIEWPVTDPILSQKDANAPTLKEWLNTIESNTFSVG